MPANGAGAVHIPPARDAAGAAPVTWPAASRLGAPPIRAQSALAPTNGGVPSGRPGIDPPIRAQPAPAPASGGAAAAGSRPLSGRGAVGRSETDSGTEMGNVMWGVGSVRAGSFRPMAPPADREMSEFPVGRASATTIHEVGEKGWGQALGLVQQRECIEYTARGCRGYRSQFVIPRHKLYYLEFG